MQKYSKVNTSALDVANYLLVLAKQDGISLDPLTLQKLLYHCQCWSLLDGQRLFDDHVEAWKHGPVVRNVWKAYSGYSRIQPTETLYYELAHDQIDLIQSVWETLKHMHGTEMSAQSHEPGTAWSKARGKLPATADSNQRLKLEDLASDAERLRAESESALLKSWDRLKEMPR